MIRCIIRGHRWIRYGQARISWPDGSETALGPRMAHECTSCGKIVEWSR